jgi:hypothetical protein
VTPSMGSSDLAANSSAVARSSSTRGASADSDIAPPAVDPLRALLETSGDVATMQRRPYLHEFPQEHRGIATVLADELNRGNELAE